ncbi:MAG: DUF2207 domain-containing protein [Gemmatimonadetes bacterium]|nr:DUF2207 domain-containing protein [Gemmatimonadota bacterium]
MPSDFAAPNATKGSPPRPLARSLVIESFHADIVVNRDGSLAVTETIRPRFTGAWNGIYRQIPVQYRTPEGFGYRLVVELLSVTDGEGLSLRYETERERHYLRFRIWVPDAVDATRTVVLSYRVRNGLRFFDDYDELYWNVTGDEADVPIESASATVMLPPSVTGLRANAFTGAYGSRERAATIETGEFDVRVRTTRGLGFREGLTVAAAWEPGVVRRPTALDRAREFLSANWLFAVPMLAFVVMARLWYTRGRDPRRRPIVAQYTPPDGLTPAETGTLVDNSPDLRDITATIVDLAVRGYLRIEEEKDGGLLGLFSGTHYRFRAVKDEAEWQGLASHESALLEALFEGGSRKSVTTSDLEDDFYRDLPGIRNRLLDALVKRGYYRRRPDRIAKTFVGVGILAGVLVFAGGSALGRELGFGPTTVIVSAVLTAAAIVGFGFFMPARTAEGARALEAVLGLEEFLARVESDRFRRLVKTPEMFEKLLPFAMALGVEKRWARAFHDIYQTPPTWYVGADPTSFRATTFANSLSRMSTAAGAAMVSRPRSSGGSAFGGGGGGGFSGGGFGGGSVGGF